MNVIQLFKNTVAQYPDKIAVDDLTQTLTFSELDALSDAIAAVVAAHIDEPRKPVAVLMEKSSLMLAAFLGVAKAGCFYVPIGEDQPKERVASMLGVLEDPFVLTEELIRDIQKDMRNATVDAPGSSVYLYTPIATDPLYAIFTSGSTGTPKCVVVSHGALLSFIETFVETFGITSDDTFANQAPFDFDISVKDIYSCFATGAKLVLLPRKYFSFPAQLMGALVEKKPTVLVWAVSAIVMVSQFRMCAPLAEAGFAPRMVAFSGEVMPSKHFLSWRDALPETQFVNLYGPTEITCNCAFYEVPLEGNLEFPLPTGKAFAHNRVFLVDEGGNTPPSGALGEICVQGPNVALGYYRNPEQTASAFTSDPTAEPDAFRTVVYHTGDLASMGDDGLLRFAGRADNQVKYMGHRIELSEVEAAFDDMPEISRCVCILNDSANRLELHYTIDDTNADDIEASAFASHAESRLPAPMTPKHFVRHADFPRTRNGKIDRRALKEIQNA